MTLLEITLNRIGTTIFFPGLPPKKTKKGYIVAETEVHDEKLKKLLLKILSLFVIGFGVGWLAGLSVSPVATILISGLLGIAISIVGITTISLKIEDVDGGVRRARLEAVEDISIGMLALIVFGIVVGVNVGIGMRTHNTLGIISAEKQDDSFVKLRKDLYLLQNMYNELEKDGEQNSEQKIGLKQSKIAQRILDKYYPKGGVVNKSEAASSSSSEKASKKDDITREGVLFSAENIAKPCETLQVLIETYPESDLRSQIEESSIFFERISKNINSYSELEEVVKIICESNAEGKQ